MDKPVCRAIKAIIMFRLLIAAWLAGRHTLAVNVYVKDGVMTMTGDRQGLFRSCRVEWSHAALGDTNAA